MSPQEPKLFFKIKAGYKQGNKNHHKSRVAELKHLFGKPTPTSALHSSAVAAVGFSPTSLSREKQALFNPMLFPHLPLPDSLCLGDAPPATMNVTGQQK